jgi:ABC-2 type transport system ATP-binding protein
MWQMVRSLRETGVTIILTTHYIEEAEQMADRIGIINKGEIVLVEEKSALMEKLGKKELILQLEQPLRELPAKLASYELALSQEGKKLTYTFHAEHDRAKIATLLRDLAELGIVFTDLHTRASSLEDINVSLVRSQA